MPPEAFSRNLIDKALETSGWDRSSVPDILSDGLSQGPAFCEACRVSREESDALRENLLVHREDFRRS